MIAAFLLLVGFTLVIAVAWGLALTRPERLDIRPAQDVRHVLRGSRVHRERQRIEVIR
jgi:hypothetical protein